MPTKIKLIVLAAVLWLGMPKTVMATAQIPDILIVGKDTLYLFCNPLEGYFDKEHPRPNDMFGMSSTACWRGYQAYFELRSDSLFLIGIRLDDKGDSTDFYPLANLFGDKVSSSGVFAYWVNGTLVCIGGEQLYYIHMGYASIYEFDIDFKIQKGILKHKRVFDNRRTFMPFSQKNDDINLFKTFVEQQIDYSQLAPDDKKDWVVVNIEKVNGNGRIKKVKIKNASRNQERAVRKALKKVPRFVVLYRRGKPMKDLHWVMKIVIYANEEEQAKQGPTRGPDIGEWTKKKISDGEDVVGNMKYLIYQYRGIYEDWKAYIADTSERERQYKEYFCQLFDDSLFYQHHYYLTLGDSALKYYYQYWDMTGDHESLYPEIVELEQELGRLHNPKIVAEKNPEFVYLVLPEDMDATHQGDAIYINRRCRQVSYHLRGFGEGNLHKPLSQGIQEEWRLLLLRRGREASPVLVKVTYDGKDARIIWRVAKETEYKTYPGLEHFRHGIRSEGERLLNAEEWNQLKSLADKAGIDTLHLDNDYFSSPPAIYNVEHRTASSYHIINDYNHPYYSGDINPLFWPYRAFCKYLIHLADPSLPFDSDDKR